MVKLTPKQVLFCKEYIKDFNASRAALAAGYSKQTAYAMGAENLKKPQIQGYINQITKKKVEKLDISAEKVIEEIAKIAFSNVDDLGEWDENGVFVLKSSEEMSDAAKAAISTINYSATKMGESLVKTDLKITKESKLKALELLGKYTGAFNKDESEKQNINIQIADWLRSDK